MKKLLIFNLIALGMTSIVSQIIVIRELLVAFYGNELSMAVVLGCWLFWVGIGSYLAGLFLDRFVRKHLLLLIAQTGIIVFPLITILVSRNITNIIGVKSGEIIGFLPILYSSFILLAPLCLILGGLFVILSRIIVDALSGDKEGLATAYIWEAVGAGFGGLLYNFILIHILNPIQIYSFWASLNAGLLAVFMVEGRNVSRYLKRGGWVILWLLLFIVSLKPAQIVDKASIAKRWKGTDLVDNRDSIYGNIAVIKKESQYSIYENGLLVFSSGDKLSQEESVHFALLSHPAPSRVLLIGGGLGGTMGEVLKHRVKEVTYIELDHRLIDMAQRHIPQEESIYLEDERVNLLNKDGRLYVKEMAGKEKFGRYEVAIINLPDPYTAQLNRFYSREFFNEIRDILTEDGILCFGITSSENYISTELANLLSCIYKTLKEPFQGIVIIPGDTNYFIASRSNQNLTDNWRIMQRRLDERGIETQFVNKAYMPYKMSQERMDYVKKRISFRGSTRINRDFNPVGYFYDMILWSTYFNTTTREWIQRIEGIGFWHIAVIILTLFSICAFLVLRIVKGLQLPVTIAIGTTGFSEILFQMVIIVGFQVLYGYVYYKIGIILGSFMLGLVFGGLYARRKVREFSIAGNIALFLKTQFFIALYPLLLIPLFVVIGYLQKRFGLLYGIDSLFAFIPFLSGFLGGVQFPLAASIEWQGGGRAARTVGTIYSVDLLGSCIGAISVAVILVPILGIIKTCLVAGMLNFAVFILLIIGRKVEGRQIV